MFRFYTLLIVSTVACFTAMGQDSTRSPQHRWWHKYRPDSVQNWNLKVLPVPTFSSSPETGVKVGVALNYFFNASGKDSLKKSRDSYIYADLQYSTRRQLFTELYGQVYTSGEKYFLRGRLGYLDNYERVWGFGNFSVPNNRFQEAFYSRWYLQLSATRQLKPGIFAGVRTNFSTMGRLRTNVKDTNLLAGRAGEKSSLVSGLGPTLIFDFRDHPLGPEKGWYAEIATTIHGRALGSQYHYTEILTDLRKYMSYKKHTVALQAFAQLNTGTVPWREMPRMGNATIMRGYFSGRFRGSEYAAVQAEYRYRINRFLGIAAFGSAGQVQENIRSASWGDVRMAGGGGLRIYANQKKRITIRIDYGVTSDRTSGFYVKVGEAF